MDFHKTMIWLAPLLCACVGVGFYFYLNIVKTDYVLERIKNGACIEHDTLMNHEYRLKRIEEFCCTEIED